MPFKKICCLFVVSCVLAPPGLYSLGAPTGTFHETFLTQTHVVQYRRWVRVNPAPVLFHAAPATQCAAANSSQQPSPHRDKYITVYVNDIGKAAMLTQQKPVFPVGSVLVKEKSANKNGTAIELLTVMVKREKGYDPTGGDWEYAVLDGKAATVQAQGKLANCQNCHKLQRYQGYIFRDAYLPDNLRSRLK